MTNAANIPATRKLTLFNPKRRKQFKVIVVRMGAVTVEQAAPAKDPVQEGWPEGVDIISPSKMPDIHLRALLERLQQGLVVIRQG